jgi:hypothetical protein
MAETAGANAIRVRVSLVGSEPLIWRELLVPIEVRLDRFHRIIQTVMGWHDTHLHQFSVGETTYGLADDDAPDDELNEAEHALVSILDESQVVEYEYDFGDSWHHRIEIMEHFVADPSLKFGVVLAGANACPLEDSGGVSNYTALIEIFKNPSHAFHEQVCEDFEFGDPFAFDRASVNARLQRI